MCCALPKHPLCFLSTPRSPSELLWNLSACTAGSGRYDSFRWWLASLASACLIITHSKHNFGLRCCRIKSGGIPLPEIPVWEAVAWFAPATSSFPPRHLQAVDGPTTVRMSWRNRRPDMGDDGYGPGYGL
ncbi:hypothetical protein B0H10DRAFT_2201551 [Mycena sp. CBHHK59/15]|nr:hypothetical protein B0H10DRAFT_2201551 [Mycena sp. CBHHK59/15]